MAAVGRLTNDRRRMLFTVRADNRRKRDQGAVSRERNRHASKRKRHRWLREGKHASSCPEDVEVVEPDIMTRLSLPR